MFHEQLFCRRCDEDVYKRQEQTSVQDILDATGLSKGGLYHHFKSKEQILDAVMQRRIQYVNKRFQELIRNTPDKNAKEKLKKILGQLAADAETHALDQALASQLDPHFVVNGIQTCVAQDAPIVAGLIREGNRDGSLHVQQPELCAEVFLMLLNYCCLLYTSSPAPKIFPVLQYPWIPGIAARTATSAAC